MGVGRHAPLPLALDQTPGFRRRKEGEDSGGGVFVSGIDSALFQVASFFDEEDVAALGALCGAADD